MLNFDEYLQIKDAAVFLGVSENTLRNWGKAGKIVEHRHPINNYRLYDRADLESLLRQLRDSAAKQKPK
ncbi:MAG: helix-turn-helix domain-containing protein [Planctomycetales bacterium]|nr:helix-turn-helix domain-containing protein [Planctomycetales bacterium]